MEYILGKKTPGCIFCDFPTNGAATYRENLVLVVQEHAFVCLNRYPFTSCHLLVVPRRHVSSLDDLSDEEYAALSTLIRTSAKCLSESTRSEGMNIGYNLGKAAGAGIAEHLHAHLVPRWSGDSNFMPVLADVRVMPEYLDEAWQRLMDAFADVPGERGSRP